jgi:predicted unusual protein kinase regulating ubiquinone biosynthesis (AarF/ABC1/UbiB family)
VLVTPVAQVHHGELEGSPVAVKVLRPGLAGAVRQDLALLESLAGPAGAAFPAADIGALLREVRERVLDDFDLEHQGQALRRLHRALRGHPRITVPAPITRLTDETVLVREWVDGVPLTEAAPDARDRACAHLVIFALGAARSGLTTADLQLDELFVTADGRTAVADVGSSAVVDPKRIDAVTQLVEAFVADDSDAMGAQLAALGWLPADRAPAVLALAREVLGPFAEGDPVRLDSGAVIALRDRALGRPGPLLELLVAARPDPSDLWPGRGLGQLFAAIARAGATAPWRELIRAGLRDGWDAAV